MAMTIVQLQAFIDSKPDTRAIINEIADYLQANPGGGGNTIYTANDALTGNRVVDLNGFFLDFITGGATYLSLNGVEFVSQMKAEDGTALSRIRVRADIGGDIDFNLSSGDGTNAVEIFGNPVAQTITLQAANGVIVANNNFQITTPKTPASAADAGTIGQIAWDSDFVYVCVATNTWKRTAIATW